jgi:cyclohexyl-isocyanide hydratase
MGFTLHRRQHGTNMFSSEGFKSTSLGVAVDGNIIIAAGVTVGLDAARVLVSLLRGDAAAQGIQLAIEYAPDPVFQSGTPDTASAAVLESFRQKYKPIGAAREAEALRHAASGSASRNRS